MINRMKLRIVETKECDLENVQSLWADGDVMKFVGFPNGLQLSKEEINRWYQRIAENRPNVNHYSIYLGDEYCGESFYRIETTRDHSASVDIKLLSKARGKGIAKAALSYAIAQAFSNGAGKVWVDPNPQNVKALALYERLGFKRCEIPSRIRNEQYNQVYMELGREELLH